MPPMRCSPGRWQKFAMERKTCILNSEQEICVSFYIVLSQCQQQSFDKPYNNHEKRPHPSACFFLIYSFSSSSHACVYIYWCVCKYMHACMFMVIWMLVWACLHMFAVACTLMFTCVWRTVVDAEWFPKYFLFIETGSLTEIEVTNPG